MIEDSWFDSEADYFVEVCVGEDCTSAAFGPSGSEGEQTLARLSADFEHQVHVISMRPRRSRLYGTQHVWVTVVDDDGGRIVFWDGEVRFREEPGCGCVAATVTVPTVPQR